MEVCQIEELSPEQYAVWLKAHTEYMEEKQEMMSTLPNDMVSLFRLHHPEHQPRHVIDRNAVTREMVEDYERSVKEFKEGAQFQSTFSMEPQLERLSLEEFKQDPSHEYKE